MAINQRLVAAFALVLTCSGLGGCRDASTEAAASGDDSPAVSVLLPESSPRFSLEALEDIAWPAGVLIVEVDQTARARLLGLSTSDGLQALESPDMSADALVAHGALQAKEANGGAPPDVVLLVDRRCRGSFALQIVQSLRPDIFEVRSLSLGFGPASNPVLLPVACGVDDQIRQNLGALIISEEGARYLSWRNDPAFRYGVSEAGSFLRASGEAGMVTLVPEPPVSWGRVAAVLLELLDASGLDDRQLFLELHGLGWGLVPVAAH
jgi:hypothetical protein